MLKAVIFCIKCLLFYLLVRILAIRFAWIFTLPVWSIATRLHWTQLTAFVFSVSYFLPIFTAAGFFIGLLPLGQLGWAIATLLPANVRERLHVLLDTVPASLWAWLPVTAAFLVRYFSWHSRNSSVVDPRAITAGRFVRFFGTIAQQNPSLLDPQWSYDRFLLTGPMLFLMAYALAVFIRRRFTGESKTTPATVQPAAEE